MRLLTLFALSGLFAATAFAETAEPQAVLLQWQRLRDPDTANIYFAEGFGFLSTHPGWPDEKLIRLRTETAALATPPQDDQLRAFCKKYPPISGRGMFACLSTDPEDKRTGRIREAWRNGDFSEAEENQIIARYGNLLGPEQHIGRIDRMLYEEKATAAKRMLPRLPAARRPLYETRIALILHDKKAPAMLKARPKSEQQTHGIVFERAKQALADKKYDQLIALVRPIPANASGPSQWWPLRQMAVRELMAKQQYNQALALLSHRGTLEGDHLAEALWLEGWLLLEYKRDSVRAYKEFHTLYTNVNTPVSKARAAYWAGRAANQNGNPEIAREWFAKAAEHPTVFYGQLGHIALNPDQPLPLPPSPTFTPEQERAFAREELPRVIQLLSADKEKALVDRFLTHLILQTDDPTRMALIANLAGELGGLSSRVKVAKQALRKQVVLLDAGWPRIPLPRQLGVEPSLALAIARQESEFNSDARSSANAQGLMQLLPSTARQVAKRNDITYTDRSLENPLENLTLGSTYLGQVIDGFGGSYILGIASYNGGPGSVRRWLNSMGSLVKKPAESINWIESVPYGETRNYIMRVLENLQVYRALAMPEAPPQLAQDLVR